MRRPFCAGIDARAHTNSRRSDQAITRATLDSAQTAGKRPACAVCYAGAGTQGTFSGAPKPAGSCLGAGNVG